MCAGSQWDIRKDLGVVELSSTDATDPEGPHSLPGTFCEESIVPLLMVKRTCVQDHETKLLVQKCGLLRLKLLRREYGVTSSHKISLEFVVRQ